MKPGEFVNWEGKPAKVEYIGVRTLDDNYCLFPEQSDFPAAVAALQALIQPKPTVPLAGVHPGVGLRWCGEEEAFEWWSAGNHYRFTPGDGVEYRVRGDDYWCKSGEISPAAFDAGRRYERERG